MPHYRYQYQRRRYNLWRADPHCHWCGVLTTLPDPYPAKGVQPPDLATLDHVESRYVRSKGTPTTTVLACFRCNQQRSKEEEATLPREQLWRRSGRLPGGKLVNGDTALGHLLTTVPPQSSLDGAPQVEHSPIS